MTYTFLIFPDKRGIAYGVCVYINHFKQYQIPSGNGGIHSNHYVCGKIFEKTVNVSVFDTETRADSYLRCLKSQMTMEP
ncbi:hypothetical protein B5E77_12650 [Lachnoclostridium sp. An131]|nr:hypothetical protein B5E77_12650 [Lachnoclostridium sp. An131]